MSQCVCGGPGEQPWSQRDTLVSPASFLAGLILLGVGVAVAVVPGAPHAIGWGLLGLFAVAVVIGWVVSALRGHHLLCVLGRGLWLGVAWPGLPLRVVLSAGNLT